MARVSRPRAGHRARRRGGGQRCSASWRSTPQGIGAAGISSILPPVVYNLQGVVPFFERIAAAAPELPFLPYLFGFSRDAVALMRDLAHIPNLAGTKYTGPNMYEMSQIVRFRLGRLDRLFGDG